MSKTILFALAAALTLAACSDPVAPAPGGAYALKTVGTSPLPVVGWESEGFTSFLVGDTLTFNADGTGLEVVAFRFESTKPLEEPGQTERNAFTWTQHGSALEITIFCGD